jgi:hypothetical protein
MGSLLCAKAGLRSGLMGLVDWEGDGDLDFPPPRHAWSSAPNPNQTAVAVGITTRSLSLCPSTTSTDLAIRDLPSMRAPRTPGHGAAGGRRGVCPVIPMPKRQSHLTARTAAGRQPFIAVHCSEENPHSSYARLHPQVLRHTFRQQHHESKICMEHCYLTCSGIQSL